MRLERVVVVTGGASGIGLGISKLLAKRHPLLMLDVQEDALQAESSALRAQGAKVLACKVDVTRREQIDAAYAAARRELGPICIVIANASCGQSFMSLPMQDWQTMINVNLTGVFHSVQAALPDMLQRQWGRVVTISSHAAQRGASDRAYAAAMAGVIGLTKALARELARDGITVNTIPPSGPALDVIVRQSLIARARTCQDIAQACEFLCSDKAGYITGQSIHLNGGAFI